MNNNNSYINSDSALINADKAIIHCYVNRANLKNPRILISHLNGKEIKKAKDLVLDTLVKHSLLYGCIGTFKNETGVFGHHCVIITWNFLDYADRPRELGAETYKEWTEGNFSKRVLRMISDLEDLPNVIFPDPDPILKDSQESRDRITDQLDHYWRWY